MTGLDLDRHVIVEIATLLTDDNLNIIAEGPDIVINATPAQLAQMDDVVLKMHSDSGLLGEIETSTTSLEQAGEQTLEFLRSNVTTKAKIPLCGNSIGMDRRFLDRYLPEIDGYLHYRSVDVSTIKELCKRWYPSIYGNSPAKSNSHRALDDIRESVAELAYYRETFFRLPHDLSQPDGLSTT